MYTIKIKYWLGISIFLLILLSACVPFGYERYFSFSFVQLDEPDFEIKLLFMTEYTGDIPPSQPTDTLFIDIVEGSQLKRNSVDTVTFEIEKIDIKGSANIGETIEIDRTSLSNDELNKIVEEAEPLVLRLQYVDKQNKVNNRTIKLKYDGEPIEYYNK